MTLAEFILAWRALAPTVKGKCFYCGKQTSKDGKPHHARFQTKDHVIPHSTRGDAVCKTTHGNRVICCWKCNHTKSDLSLFEFKQVSGIETFYAEEVLGLRIDTLSDIAEVNLHIMNTRKVSGRSIKFNGKPEIRVRPQDLSPSNTTESSDNPQV
jgi:HNH endonuclease